MCCRSFFLQNLWCEEDLLSLSLGTRWDSVGLAGGHCNLPSLLFLGDVVSPGNKMQIAACPTLPRGSQTCWNSSWFTWLPHYLAKAINLLWSDWLYRPIYTDCTHRGNVCSALCTAKKGHAEAGLTTSGW